MGRFDFMTETDDAPSSEGWFFSRFSRSSDATSLWRNAFLCADILRPHSTSSGVSTFSSASSSSVSERNCGALGEWLCEYLSLNGLLSL